MNTRRTPEPADGAAPPREWDARAYHTLSAPQFAWGKRVLSTLELRGDELVIDAGCGTGRLTALLAERLPRGCVVGVDRSANMIAKARDTLAPFENRAAVALADLVALPFRTRFDVVFSTATFHWIRDHNRLFAELHDVLRPGGILHAQCGGGRNLERIHGRAQELMDSAEFASLFKSWNEPWEFADAATTRERLRRAGFDRIDTNVEAAPVAFADAEAYAAFVSAVVLRPFLARIPDDGRREAFVDRITTAAAADTPAFELDYWRLNLRARSI